MRKLFTFLLIVLVVVGVVGFYQGWFAVGANSDPATGKHSYEFTVDPNKFQQDFHKLTTTSADGLKKPAEPFVTEKIEGTVQQADEAGRLLTIKTRAGAVMTFLMDNNVPIRLRTGNGTWRDLVMGMPVQILYDTRGGQQHAQTVVVLTPA